MAITSPRISARAQAAAIERETRLIREAVAMVAEGASPRVVVAGIRNGEALLDSTRGRALEAGVRLTAIWRQDGKADIAAEPIYE